MLGYRMLDKHSTKMHHGLWYKPATDGAIGQCNDGHMALGLARDTKSTGCSVVQDCDRGEVGQDETNSWSGYGESARRPSGFAGQRSLIPARLALMTRRPRPLGHFGPLGVAMGRR